MMMRSSIPRRVFSLVASALLYSTAANAALEAPVDVATADNAFGFRLLDAVQKTLPSRNVVISPVSAALALALVLDGAEDQTRQEMLSALSLGGRKTVEINAANARLIKIIRTALNSVTLSVADSLWVDSPHLMLRPDFEKQMRVLYDAEITGLDFSKPGAAAEINSWAAKETHGRISKIIEHIDPTDRLLLLNAVYFKGEWAHKFDKTQTQQGEFTLSGGLGEHVMRMAQSARFDYFETPLLQAIRLPFGDGNLVMEIVLPAISSSLEALEAQLTAEHWSTWQTQFAPRDGTIELPRFELKASYRLNESLQTLGMTRAFRPDAQLGGLVASAAGRPGAARFFISSVLQSTYWKVDEEGSEAAAVTATGIRAEAVLRSAQPFRMIVDRPYLCAIEDRRSHAILFVGSIYDPTI